VFLPDATGNVRNFQDYALRDSGAFRRRRMRDWCAARKGLLGLIGT
jgi:hypothetical protein